MDWSPRTDLEGDVVIINSAGPFAPQFTRRGGASRKKQRTSIEIISEPLLMDFDEFVLGEGPAVAIRDAISNGIKGITEMASLGTRKRREVAARALSAGAEWAVRRYSGGRTGATPPNQSPRLFNDSSRLANGVFVRENKEDQAWTVNVPANRLDPSTFTGGGFQAMLDKLRSLVPVLQDARNLLLDKGVTDAINKATRELITKGTAGMDETRLKALRSARLRALRAGFAALRQIAGV